MYIDRNIDQELLRWKDSSYRKPLILRGVRQCGKTEAVRHLGSRFPYYAEVNLEKNTRLHAIFETDIRIDSILTRLEVESGVPIVPGKTLLFIDEIQECPRAIAALRYFYEEKADLHIIAAGSLLEFALNGSKQPKIQFPVGRVRSIFMFPLSFSEYLTAMNLPILRKQLESAPMNSAENFAHDRLLEEYKKFLIVGGMPEAVSRFVETGSLLEAQLVHRDIIMNFREDFDKYDTNIPSETIRLVFDYSFRHACGQVRSSSAISGLSAYHFNGAIEQLKRAGLVIMVSASSCDTLPLGAGEKESNLKILPFDTGIFLSELGLSLSNILGADLFEDLNKGNLAELATGLEMIKSTDPYHEPHLYYWYRSGANAEVDYVAQVDSEIIPIEVKAAVKGGMKSLRSYLSSHSASFGIRTSLENYAQYDDIQVIPLYAACRIHSIHPKVTD